VDISRLAELRPRFVWDILDDAFDLYRERFSALCGIAAAAHLPIALVEISRTVSQVRQANPAGEDEFWGNVRGYTITVPLLLAIRVIESAATAVVVQERLADRNITMMGAYGRVFRRAPAVIGGALWVALLGLLGFVTFGIGTLAVYVYASFLGQALVLEGRGVWGAWRRTRDLVSSDGSKVVGVAGLMFLVTAVLALGLGTVVQGIYAVVPAQGDVVARAAQEAIAQQAAGTLTRLLLVPLESAAITLLYFDLRVRREGIDLVAAAEERGVSLAPDPFGDVSSARVVKQQRKRRPKQDRGRKREETPSGAPPP
jgi:hypothetical protein